MKPAKKEREPSNFVLSNPSRLIPTQIRYINVQSDQRYAPIFKRSVPMGIVILADSDPTAPEDVAKGKDMLVNGVVVFSV